MRLALRLCFAVLIALLLSGNVFAQSATPTPDLGTIELSFRDHEGKYLTDLSIRIYRTQRNANGEFVLDYSRRNYVGVLPFKPNGKGIESAQVPPGFYFLSQACCPEEQLRFLEIHPGVFEVKTGQTFSYHPIFARVDFVARAEDGSFVYADAGLYIPKRDPNGKIIPPTPDYSSRLSGPLYKEGDIRMTGKLGVASVKAPPGLYTFAYRLEEGPVEWTYEEITLEPGMRYLKGNLLDWSTRGAPGRYYTQTGQNQGGYNVTDQGDVLFWSEYQRLGGVDVLGYQTSSRFTYKGRVMQAFQKVLLMWNPSLGVAEFFDSLREMATLRGEEWLTFQGVPERIGFETEDEAYALLELNPTIRDYYYSLPNSLEMLGLPEGYGENPEQILMRTRKGVLQFWLVPKPWAKVGEITFMNVGDLAKRAGMIPEGSVNPTAAI